MWDKCGCPDFELEDLRKAREEVKGWLGMLGKAHPEWVCSCGKHLILSLEQLYYCYLESNLLHTFMAGRKLILNPGIKCGE